MPDSVSNSKTSTTIVVSRDKGNRVSLSREPLLALCRRVFRDTRTQSRAADFLSDVLERAAEDDPVRTEEWEDYLERWDISRSSFYSMRNQLVGAGLITVREGEYRPSTIFSRDLRDMADWWEAQVE